jgi:antitoxin (DNA-binding transcriptional repressor) of toxin-antitoxin stability system
MNKVTVEEAQASLPDIIAKTPPGEGVLIVQDDKALAELIRLPLEKPRPLPGRCKGMLTVLSDDDEHLKDWIEYMP